MHHLFIAIVQIILGQNRKASIKHKKQNAPNTTSSSYCSQESFTSQHVTLYIQSSLRSHLAEKLKRVNLTIALNFFNLSLFQISNSNSISKFKFVWAPHFMSICNTLTFSYYTISF